MELLAEFLKSLIVEMELVRHYLPGRVTLQTIYFGGGTPSLLSKADFDALFEAVRHHWHVDTDAEITIEANPDDLTEEYVDGLASLPVNRISIGVQSFNDELLTSLNRRHTSRQALQAVDRVRRAGFENVSIDLLYGVPGQTLDEWEEEIDTALGTRATHISAYGLTCEEGTPLQRMLAKGKMTEVDEEVTNEMYRRLRTKLTGAGFEAYEISNFALPGFRSRHNSSYWQGIPYIGIGPSAHSYNGYSRRWNCNNLHAYIRAVAGGTLPARQEVLSEREQYNDFVMLSLRTAEGIDLQQAVQMFPKKWIDECLECARPFLRNGQLEMSNGRLRLTTEGILVSNLIMSELMRTE